MQRERSTRALGVTQGFSCASAQLNGVCGLSSGAEYGAGTAVFLLYAVSPPWRHLLGRAVLFLSPGPGGKTGGPLARV